MMKIPFLKRGQGPLRGPYFITPTAVSHGIWSQRIRISQIATEYHVLIADFGQIWDRLYLEPLILMNYE
jgi:hypothetical protein